MVILIKINARCYDEKIFLVFFLFLMSFGYSENLDKYESKRVFDKYIEVFLIGNHEKYLNDKEMKRISNRLYLVENKEKCAKLIDIFKEYKYMVIHVDEGRSNNVL